MSDLEKKSAFLFYNDDKGKISVQVVIGDETVWLSIKGIAELFDIDRSGILKHIQNIYETGELEEKSTCAKIAQVQKEGNRDVNRVVDFYNLDMIIAVGYRVSSFKATRFRQWATRILKEYLIKGFVLDDERLKQGNNLFNKDYFKELLERIRDIRASEKLFYQKVKDFYATSVDYDKDDPKTYQFFARVQNKLEFAIIGKTSAEIIKERADASKVNMGLTTWKNAGRNGDITKADTGIAKNYLQEDEIKRLNLLVNMFLDYMELQIQQKRQLMMMNDWEGKLDGFLSFNGFNVLSNAGKIKRDTAEKFAETEFLKYKAIKENEGQLPDDKHWEKFMYNLKSGGNLPIEEIRPPETDGAEEINFDKKLKALLKVPPPKKEPRKEKG